MVLLPLSVRPLAVVRMYFEPTFLHNFVLDALDFIVIFTHEAIAVFCMRDA
jgi:hypothetical protein